MLKGILETITLTSLCLLKTVVIYFYVLLDKLILICWVHQQIVQKPSQEKKLKLTPQSKLVADHVAKLVHSAEALKGTKPL